MIATAVTMLAGLALAVLAYIKGRSSKAADDAQSRADTLLGAQNADTGNPDGSGDLEFLQRRGRSTGTGKRP
jgi:hypothetical protein